MREPLMFFMVDDPEAIGLPAEEAGNVGVCVTSTTAGLEGRLTFIVDGSYALMLAEAACQPGYTEAPLNIDAARYVRPGWPEDWSPVRGPWLARQANGRWEVAR